MKAVQIKERVLPIPIIQGGMGIGVSRYRLAGAVAREGAMGVISTAQIGYDDPAFAENPEAANLKSIPDQIRRAKELSEGNGMVGVNIMVATQDYEAYVRTACEAGVDAIISGAGLPVDLPGYTAGYNTALAPIVSGSRSAEIILRYWDRKFKRTADFLVIEGPKAGGHLGFSKEELEELDTQDYDAVVKDILEIKAGYEVKYQHPIPVFLAGGIFDASDVKHALELGADGIQAATRFVVTKECDASEAYKQAYLEAKEEDVVIINSPVGMPGRAIRNTFIRKIMGEKEKIIRCFRCLKACNPAKAPYCITRALIQAVEGNLDEGLIFCGAKVGELQKMTTAAEVIKELNI